MYVDIDFERTLVPAFTSMGITRSSVSMIHFFDDAEKHSQHFFDDKNNHRPHFFDDMPRFITFHLSLRTADTRG